MTSTDWNPFIYGLTLLTFLTFLTLWNDTPIRFQQLFQVVIGKCIWRSFSVGALHFIHEGSTLSDKPRGDVLVVRLAFILLRYRTNDSPRLGCLHDLLANLFRLLLVNLDRLKFELFQYKAVLRTDFLPLIFVILKRSRIIFKATEPIWEIKNAIVIGWILTIEQFNHWFGDLPWLLGRNARLV